MTAVFYISSFVALIATFLAITRVNAVHALLYFVLSLLAAALVFFSLGAPFVAALEVIVYAGAIMVLFLFVVMLLNQGREATEQERRWLTPGMWIGPSILAAILLIELLMIFARQSLGQGGGDEVGPQAVGAALFGPYIVAVQLASLLLLAGVVGAFHLARTERRTKSEGEES